MIKDANLMALRLLSAMGHRDDERTDAMMAAIRCEDDPKAVFTVLACLYGHVSLMLDNVAPEGTPQRDQWLAHVDERTERMAAQNAALNAAPEDEPDN